MRVRFWGTRGSIPVALTQADIRDKLARALVAAAGRRFASYGEAYDFASQTLPFSVTHTFGGHTSCVELETGADEYFVCDMGSGARAFGEHILARQAGRPATVNVFMSHVHWDHIMGFPFFGPAYVRGTRIRIPSGQPTEVSGLRVTPQLQRHSGDSYGFRFEHGGRHIVYSTDSEHKLEDRTQTEAIVGFFRDADLVIFDAMYSLAEAISVKEDWGHSSNVVGVELCQLAQAKHLVLFHHEPANSDAAIEGALRDAQRLEELTRGKHALRVSAAHDGLEIEL